MARLSQKSDFVFWVALSNALLVLWLTACWTSTGLPWCIVFPSRRDAQPCHGNPTELNVEEFGEGRGGGSTWNAAVEVRLFTTSSTWPVNSTSLSLHQQSRLQRDCRKWAHQTIRYQAGRCILWIWSIWHPARSLHKILDHSSEQLRHGWWHQWQRQRQKR